jgi:hypothetical protein
MLNQIKNFSRDDNFCVIFPFLGKNGSRCAQSGLLIFDTKKEVFPTPKAVQN